jgi:protein-glutamine gamma-glutamyltransferase
MCIKAVSILDPSPKKGENNRIPVPAPVGLGTGNNPDTRSLARSLAEDIPDPQEKLDRILAYFEKNNFTYTLTPPLAGPTLWMILCSKPDRDIVNIMPVPWRS